MNNRFVIISPSFNNEKWAEVYFESIECQTYKNYIVYYIDDCSTDNTETIVKQLFEGNDQFKYIRNDSNKGALYNYLYGFDELSTDENDILVNLDGDDWFATKNVLEKLNGEYNEHNYWMTYGKMVVYDGSESLVEAFPQNTPFHPFIHENSLYRKDVWRSSHLRTFRKFLFEKIDKKDFVSNIDNKLYWHASDLALMYPMLEMSPIEKIGVMGSANYVYNASKENSARTSDRETSENSRYEDEIRNKKIYSRKSRKEDLNGEKLPVVNVFGDFKERNSIPKNHSLVYNRTSGEFDVTLIQDDKILKFISGEIKIQNGKIIADIHEPPYLFNQSEVYKMVYDNHEMFDTILTCNEKLLTLPNSVFRNSGYEVVLNKNVHKQTYPILQDNSLQQIYPKTKNISVISSNKLFTDGHRFRVNCVNEIINNNLSVDVFGVGIREITGKIEALKDYRFSIAIENGVCKNYFTEKILDCFLTGTIPIYHGCPNISDYFDTDGFYTFDTQDQLLKIINSLTMNEYNDRIEIINDNFKKANEFWYDNDRFFNKFLSPLI
jgi:glycosyltransferase involved in cell wall biosynthesis